MAFRRPPRPVLLLAWAVPLFRRKKKAKKTDEVIVADAKQVEVRNPHEVACPRCGGTRLYVADDRSAFCLDCQRGFMEVAVPEVVAPMEVEAAPVAGNEPERDAEDTGSDI